MISGEGLWLRRTKEVRLREKNEIKKVIKGGLAELIGEVALNALKGKFNNFPIFYPLHVCLGIRNVKRSQPFDMTIAIT